MIWYVELWGAAKRIHYVDGSVSAWMPAFEMRGVSRNY